MTMASSQNLLTVEEAAMRLKVESETVRRWLRSGQLQGIKIGRLWRIPEEALSILTLMPQASLYEAPVSQ